MNIPILIILKDFIMFCEENEITEPTKENIQDYITSEHFNFLNEIDKEKYNIETFEKELKQKLENVFFDIVGVPKRVTTKPKKDQYYELITLLKPEAQENAQEKIKNLLPIDGVKIANAQDWGIKKLAYPVKNYTQGYYIYFELYINKEREKEITEAIEKTLRENDDIIKILLVPTKSGIQ